MTETASEPLAIELLAKELRECLARIPGIHPQAIGPDCTRHSFHLFCFRVDPRAVNVSRAAFLSALEAEGIPNFGGYPFPLYRQRLFLDRAFGPYSGCQGVDYAKISCRNCETICSEQGGWLEQRLLLGTREDMDDVVRAFEKVYEHRNELRDSEVPEEQTAK